MGEHKDFSGSNQIKRNLADQCKQPHAFQVLSSVMSMAKPFRRTECEERHRDPADDPHPDLIREEIVPDMIKGHAHHGDQFQRSPVKNGKPALKKNHTKTSGR